MCTVCVLVCFGCDCGFITLYVFDGYETKVCNVVHDMYVCVTNRRDVYVCVTYRRDVYACVTNRRDVYACVTYIHDYRYSVYGLYIYMYMHEGQKSKYMYGLIRMIDMFMYIEGCVN